MLFKKEKKTARYIDEMVPLPEDLLVEETEEKVKKTKKEKPNPYPVYFIFFATIFFSFGLLGYKNFNSFLQSNTVESPKISINFNLNTIRQYFSKLIGTSPKPTSPKDLEKNLEKILGQSGRNWGVYLELYSPKLIETLKWSYNSFSPVNPADTLYRLKQRSPQNNLSLAKDLPQGIVVRQNYTEQNQQALQEVLLTLPTKEILIVLKADNQLDLDKPRTLIPDLVSAIYWSFVGN